MNPGPYTLRVDADPSLGITIRMFIAEAGRGLGMTDAEIEDLRLLATELLGNAVDARSSSLELTLTSEEGVWCLRARGAGPLGAGSDDLVDRRDVLEGLANIELTADGLLELRSPTDA